VKYLFSISLLLILINPVVSAQVNYTPEESFDEGEFFFKRGDYKEALYFYLQLADSFPDNANYNYKAGMAYLNIPGEEFKAIPYFKTAVLNITDKKSYRQRSFEENRAPWHAWFYLGNAYRMNDQLDKALLAYETFIDSPYYWGNYNLAIVENEVKSAERAKIIQDNPVKYKQDPLPGHINTPASEMKPAISGDTGSLVFVRKLAFYDALFYTVRTDSGWSQPVNINPQVGSDGEFHPASLSYNGKILFLVKNDISGNKDIYISYLNNGLWSGVEKMPRPVNSMSDETHASLSRDGQYLYIASDRRRSKRGIDIFVSKKKKNGEWGRPMNIGKTINTEFDENTPFISNDGKTLFFSSKGHYNMGGYDVFYSNRKDGKWTQPINLGYPVNTTADNFFMVPVDAGKFVFLSKSIHNDNGSEDIYRIEIQSTLYHLYKKLNDSD